LCVSFLVPGLVDSVQSSDLTFSTGSLHFQEMRAAALAAVRQHDTKELLIAPSGD
jgi:hypothetical protein